jgi:UDP-N-acetylmuramoyl-tripeptide--D-alanyl-D-alanine ligase
VSATPRAEAGQLFWTAERVADALASVATTNVPVATAPFRRVWTDTRTIEPGDLFVALVGEKFDAHDFLREAAGKGAAGVVISKAAAAKGIGVPAYLVSDTLVALGALGTYRRRAWNKPVIAVVGANGKTSTKELLRAALGSVLEVHATSANLNNLVGVPLTLLSIPDAADIAVVEMGTNSPGEVPRLRAIVEPDVTVVTSIGEEHLEGLGDLEGVMREEMAATDGVPLAIVPASQENVAEVARARAKHVTTAGIDHGDVSGTNASVDADGCGHATVDGVELMIPLRGSHNLRNAMLAIAAARAAGVSVDDAARGIAAMPVPAMRVNLERMGSVTLINDAYNANPGSTRAALELLSHAAKGKQRVAILGSMLELGPHTPRLHDEIAREVLASGVELIGALGEFGAAFERLAPHEPRVVTASDTDGLWAGLSSRVTADAVILLKGSRGMRLERLLKPIADWAARQDATTPTSAGR